MSSLNCCNKPQLNDVIQLLLNKQQPNDVMQLMFITTVLHVLEYTFT